MIKGNRHIEGMGMNKDTKVTIDMPGDDTNLLMDSHVSHFNWEQHARSSFILYIQPQLVHRVLF